MPIDALGQINHLSALQPLAPPQTSEGGTPVVGGFAGIFNSLLGANQKANAAADAAISDLASGQAQDLHTVTLALAQAETSFRTILEMRNRLSDAFQEVARMQV